jgi:predicted MFS family arabinose efflux permease
VKPEAPLHRRLLGGPALAFDVSIGLGAMIAGLLVLVGVIDFPWWIGLLSIVGGLSFAGQVGAFWWRRKRAARDRV